MRRAVLCAARFAVPVAVFAAVPLLAGPAAGNAPLPRAAGGVRLLHALEEAPATVVGLVGKTRQLDRHGYAATLRVETSVTGGLARGTVVPIAWEELARSRAPRFADGDRVLVSLERLPPRSLWRERFPDDETRAHVLAIAHAGDAFLRDPTLFGVSLLEHYAKLGSEGRASATGTRYLARLAAGAQPPLARSAVERLADLPALGKLLEPEEGALLVQALLRPDGEGELREALLALVERRRPAALRPALEAEAARGEGADPVVFLALGRLDGSLPPERTALLLREGPPPAREAAARYASGPDAGAQLRKALAGDPEPAVRAAAVARLVALEHAGALVPATRALDDPDEGVRQATAQALAELGPAAVPSLRGVVETGALPAARAAVAGLVLSKTEEAASALSELAASHEDPSIRLLARIGLGQPIGDAH